MNHLHTRGFITAGATTLLARLVSGFLFEIAI